MKQFFAFCFAFALFSGIAQAQCGSMAGHDHQAPGHDQAKPHDHQAAGHDMSAMHDQMMKNMQADLDGMKANLQKMKDLLAKTKDASAKEQLQLDINMWQSLIGNMDKHMQMMKSMHEHMGMGGGMGMGGHDMHGKGMEGHDMHGMGGGMSCCKGDGKDGMSCGKDGGCNCGKTAPDGKPAAPDASKKPS